MRTIQTILIVVLSCFLLASCEKETILTVNQQSLSFNNSGGSQTVNLIANKVWSASSNQGWCRVSPSSGDGSDNSNFTLSVSCDANTTYDERSCTITVICEELTSTITVTQAEGKGLIVSQTEYNLTNEAQTISVEVQANVQYTVSIDDACKSWIKQESTKGLSSNTIKFAISKNESYDGREGKIIVKQTDGSLSGTVVVKQSQQNALFVTTSEYNLSNEKHTLTVEVKANVEFDVKSNADWIKYVETKGLKTSQIVLDVAANEDYDGREGTVTVKQKNGNLEGVITIRQEQNYGILVSQSEFALSNEAQTIDVEVKYNVGFDVVIPDTCKDWISIVGTKGLSSRNFTVAIAKNETYDNREGSITFKQKNGSLSGTVEIKQNQANGLFAENREYEVTHEEQILNVIVKANIDYQVVIDDACKDWISQVQTKGLSESTVSLSIIENEGKARTGKVILSGDNCSDSILIKQASGYIQFADDNFKTYCVNLFDRNGDGEISYAEALGVTYIDCNNKNIKSLSGIEFFKDLKTLRCAFNQMGSLDVSNNTALEELNCRENQMVFLNVSGNSKLQTLVCGDNQLKSLDVGDCPMLWGLYCYNNQLTSLDISKNSALQVINCEKNQIDNLDFSKKTNLQAILCTDNNIFHIDVSDNTELTTLRCAGNRLTSLDISKNIKLTDLGCSDNHISSLDVSHNTLLASLWCGGNPLPDLCISENVELTSLECSCIGLTSLDVSNNVLLSRLACENNKISSLDVSKNTALTVLNCSNNQLASLDIRENTLLTAVYCQNNRLSKLDVWNNPLLERIICDSNEITEIDICNNTVLIDFSCKDNQLEILNFSNNPSLKTIYCEGNLLTTLDISNNIKLNTLQCSRNPYLTEILLKKSQMVRIKCDETVRIKYIE